MTYVVTGCAGFIGSSFVDRLLSMGHSVVGIDNFSTGRLEFLTEAMSCDNFTLIEADLLDVERISPAFNGAEMVFHFSANADVRFGLSAPDRDLQQNTIATFNVLEAMRINGVRKIIFSSTGSVYGEAEVIPTPENASFPIQTSLYGASKLACEGMIAAYSGGFGIQSYIFRFVSILGERYTHGHVFDFYKQLKNDPNKLKVLGDGKQRKSYLYIQDCIDAVFLAQEKAQAKVNIFNLGLDEYCEVNDSIKYICSTLNVEPNLLYSGGKRGWVGDNPFIFLDTNKIESLGWKPKFSIKDGVVATVKFLQQNEWVFEVQS